MDKEVCTIIIATRIMMISMVIIIIIMMMMFRKLDGRDELARRRRGDGGEKWS